jgi:peroxiredoxin
MSFTVLEPSSINSTATFTFANLNVSGNLVTGSNTNSNLGNSATANYFIGNGSLLTGLPASYSNTNVAAYLPTYTGNISANYFIGNGSQLTGLPASYSNTNVAAYLPTYTGNVSANYFIGNGSQLTGLPASYSNTNVAAYLPTYTGNVSANYFIGNGSQLTNITGANVSGYVPNANVANSATTAGTITTNAQPNITSVGTLSSLSVTGNVSGNYFTGNGSQLTGLTASPAGSNTQVQFNDNGVLGANSNFTFNKATGILSVGAATGGSMTGANLISANYFTGTLTTAAQPNITSVGNLTTLTVTGNVSANYFIGNGSQLTGITTSYSNTNVAAYLPSYTGNVSANYFIGNGSTLTSLTGANVSGYVPLATAANTAGTVTTNAQPNITSVGTLTSLIVSGESSYGLTSDILLTLTGATGVVAHDVSNGGVFYHTTPAANFTANFTNVPTTNSRVLMATLIITQGATPYISNAVQIGGVAQTIKWIGSAAPTGTANKIDIISFSLIRTGSAWIVLGQASVNYG